MKSMRVAFLFMFVFSVMQLTAQPITPDKVPQDVSIAFKYKYPDAAVSGWEMNGSNFLARFSLNGQSGSAEFTPDGKWEISKFVVSEKELPGPVITYYQKNYKNREYVIAKSEMTKSADGKSGYCLEVKKQGIKQPPPIQLYFSMSGDFERKVDPAENMADSDFPGNDIPADNEDVQPGNISKKELPTPVNHYVKDNYRDFTMKEIKFINDPVLGNCYYILLRQQGVKGQIELYFDLNGKLLKNVDGTEKPETKDKNPSAQNQTSPEKNVQQDQPVTPAPVDPEKEMEKYKVADTKVPAAVKTSFTTKVKKASSVTWYFRNREYIAKFLQAGNKGSALFTEEGTWKETRVNTPQEKLSPLIQDYLKSNYRQYNILTVEYITQPKDKFYLIRVADKRSKTQPAPVTELFFDSSGKFRSANKPDTDDPYDAAQKQRKDEMDKEFEARVDATAPQYKEGQIYNDPVDPKELPTMILEYIKANYREHKIKESRVITDDILGNVYYVVMKIENLKPVTKLYFDLTGKLLKKVDEAEQKYQQEVKIDEFESEGGGLSEDQPVKTDELPSPIKKFLKKEYPDHRVREAWYKTEGEFGNHYHIVLKKQGDKRLVNLYFDLNGNVLKTTDQTDTEE